ncbi:MAG: HEAT repeat domain-containing protein, partial [Promethearchaeia archaeon]
MKCEAAKTLGALHDEKALKPLKWILEKETISPQVRLDALKSVLRIHSKEAELDLLIRQLNSKSQKVYAFIKNCILDLDPEKCISALLNSIQDKSFKAEHKISIIEQVGSVLSAVFPKSTDKKDLDNQEFFKILLSNKKQVCDFLASCLKKKDIKFQGNCLLVLDLFGKELINELTHILSEGEFLAQENAIKLIGKLKIEDQKIIDQLLILLDDMYSEVSRKAIDVLGEIGNENCVPRLMNALNIEDDSYEYIDLDFKWNILETVKKIYLNLSDASYEYLYEVLDSDNNLFKESVAYLMGEIGNEVFIDSLLLLIRERNLDVRKNAIIALGKIGHKNTIEPLLRIIERKSTYWLMKKVGVDAIYNLFQQNWPNPNNLDEQDRRIYFRSKQILADYLDKNEHECFKVKIGIIKFLGNFGDKLVLDTLERQKTDFHRLVRINAENAIKRIEDRLESKENKNE